MRSWPSFPLFRPLKIGLATFDDRAVDDELLRYLVGTVHSSRGPLFASLAMGALITFMSWAMTGEPLFLAYFVGNLIVGAGRLYCLRQHRRHATPADSRETTLTFDSAFTFWSTLYALILGFASYGLAAAQPSHDTLPLAVGCCAGFTIAFVTRSSGRMKLLVNQVVAITVPVTFGMVTLPITYGFDYAIMFVGLAMTSIVLGRDTNAKITELFHANEANRRMARRDMLTGVMNRFSFAVALDEMLAATSERLDERFALVTIDLDRFKEINDTVGHVVGDAVIVEMAARLREAAGPRDIVARLGGDEFAILSRGADDISSAGSLARRVVDTLRRPFELDALLLPASASVGVALYPEHGSCALDLVKHADIALFEAKRAGRGRFRIFDGSMRSKLADARMLEMEMVKAIREDQFEAWFQPIQNIETGAIAGYEALARWRHPTLGLIPPDRFIPVAEQSGAIVALGQLILEKACAAAASWDPRLTIAVNLSPGQFRKPEELVAAIKDTLARTGLQPSRLYIEITESLLMEDTPRTRFAINELSDHGVHFSLDDFGAGYSSLSYIQSYPFSEIKIDKKFIDRIATDTVSTAIVASVCVLAERIYMEVVAEGVETRVQQNALRQLGVKLAQGYLYGRPSPNIVGKPMLQLVASR